MVFLRYLELFKRNLGFLFFHSPVLFVSNLFSNVFHNYSAIIVIEGRPWSPVFSPLQVPQSLHLYFCAETQRRNEIISVLCMSSQKASYKSQKFSPPHMAPNI